MAAGTARAAAWQHVPAGDDAVAVAERAALGTSARAVMWPPGNLGQACAAVDDVLAARHPAGPGRHGQGPGRGPGRTGRHGRLRAARVDAFLHLAVMIFPYSAFRESGGP